MVAAVGTGDTHPQRVDGGRLRALDPFDKLVRRKMVHQEAQPAAIHPEYRQVVLQRFMKHMKHMAVAAKRDDAVRILDGMLAVTLGQPRKTQLCLVMTGC